jgi:uncharacterized protein YueI
MVAPSMGAPTTYPFTSHPNKCQVLPLIISNMVKQHNPMIVKVHSAINWQQCHLQGDINKDNANTNSKDEEDKVNNTVTSYGAHLHC